MSDDHHPCELPRTLEINFRNASFANEFKTQFVCRTDSKGDGRQKTATDFICLRPGFDLDSTWFRPGFARFFGKIRSHDITSNIYCLFNSDFTHKLINREAGGRHQGGVWGGAAAPT